MASPDDPVPRLAARLRELRATTWPGTTVTQKHLADAFGVSVPLISSWESEKRPKVPPRLRVEQYARFFATLRTMNADAAQLREDLTAVEDARRRALEHELLSLLAAAGGKAQSMSMRDPRLDNAPASEGPYRFADGAPVTIVCGSLPQNKRADKDYTNPDSPDFIELYSFADLDSLVELHGHVRAANPLSEVQFREASAVTRDHLTTHLVLLGGVDWNMFTAEVLEALRVPVAPKVRDAEYDEGAFEVTEPGNKTIFRPRLGEKDGHRALVEDVAHFCRGPNPYNKLRTVTLCNGMFGRGTYGAVRALTDARFRDRNAAHVREQFPEGHVYSILARVQVVRGKVVTPDWTRPEMVLHEWSEASE